MKKGIEFYELQIFLLNFSLTVYPSLLVFQKYYTEYFEGIRKAKTQ